MRRKKLFLRSVFKCEKKEERRLRKEAKEEQIYQEQQQARKDVQRIMSGVWVLPFSICGR